MAACLFGECVLPTGRSRSLPIVDAVSYLRQAGARKLSLFFGLLATAIVSRGDILRADHLSLMMLEAIQKGVCHAQSHPRCY